MLIRSLRQTDIPSVLRLWNDCVQAGEVLYYPLTAEYFTRKFMENEGCEPDHLLVAEEDGRVTGLIHGVAPETFRGGKPGNAYLTLLLVDREWRGRGVGRALLSVLEDRLRSRGAETLFISSINPVNLDWRIPGTPGHDHNNMPGLDAECAGAGFFARCGFACRYREVAMYIDLASFRMSPQIPEIREKLRTEGICTGPYDAAWDCEFDRMCDGVGSDYWRDVLRTEIAAHKAHAPNADSRFWADGVRPQGPRLLLTAVRDGQIVGFTGPVDRQKSGRGWVTGICTDPAYGRRGIATVLFSLLMAEFQREGAAFSTLFTGADNPARKIYEQAGMRAVRRFELMAKTL